ncbi:16S rRNA (uracil(1498)-N(3))-methyltransferase [Mycoplasma seminis]|uniref:Ribosomal RNA small subunit methyltransferase E n=1 Tax=Mycoplasma seminis TaxID=512749 RepID=A0ABY9HAR2_9MOLU|nr:16S rRNA (uracil(1498)-N(3))-methyltransferase [Mycoplasma seminis]WLP85632.1 16S rRNA (uracil(1498)-N(3))-methyltransferase [Mycoplasma seminis]
MNRFFVDTKVNDTFILDKETIKHLMVIRAKEKQFICVYQNEFYLCVLDDNNNAQIIQKLEENHELNNEVILALSVIKLDRFEWALQKATELGVSKIIPMLTQYTQHDLVKFNKFSAKYDRFNTILKNAAEQSFRNKIPELLPLTKFEDVIQMQCAAKFIAHEKIATSIPLPQPIQSDVLFLVGPEGGFSQDEILLAQQNGVEAISLGSRILRAETAAIYLLSQIKIQ